MVGAALIIALNIRGLYQNFSIALRDAAFQFYYEENLEALEAGGAELVAIDALSAPALPEGLHGLYIGGGFPETSAGRLAENAGFRASVRAACILSRTPPCALKSSSCHLSILSSI